MSSVVSFFSSSSLFFVKCKMPESVEQISFLEEQLSVVQTVGGCSIVTMIVGWSGGLLCQSCTIVPGRCRSAG
eukprot:2510690-Amphidinium_carterae.3